MRKAACDIGVRIFICFLALFTLNIPAHSSFAAPAAKSSYQKKKQSAENDSSVCYFVKKGDTLTRIAKDHGVSVNDLKEANGITSGNIVNGMKLKIPQSATVACAAEPEEEQKKAPVQSDFFDWPVKPVLSVTQDGDKGVKSIGVIIRSKNGSRIASASSGSVEKIGRMRGYGNYVVIKHSGGLVSVYSGLDSITVKEGTSIKKGSIIGRLETGSSELHFMLNRGGKPENPLKILPPQKS